MAIVYFYDDSDSSDQTDVSGFSQWQLFTRAPTFFAIFNTYICYSAMENIETVLPAKLHSDFAFQEQQVGYYFLS